MPRNEDMVYSLPAGTEAVTGTTIESSKYNMVLRDLEAEANAPRPIAAGGTGTTSLVGLQALVGYSADNLAALVASSAAYPVGATVQARQGGTTYRVVEADGQHVTAGGVHLIESGPMFTSRDALRRAVAAGILPQGQTVTVAGQSYVIDSTATGAGSALADLGINGVRRGDRLENLFLAAHFTTQDDTTIHISTSLDGVNFRALNSAALPGGPSFALDGRDPSITWFSGWWWIFITGNAAGSHDFALFRSRDLTNWEKHQVAMAGGPYASDTVPMPGGASPASAIWAPEPFIENGVMYVMLSIRYGADYTNIYGQTGGLHFRPYITTLTNAATVAFSAPVAMDFGAADHSLGGASRIDPSVVKHGGTYYCAIKDSYYRRIQIFSATALTGPWTYIRTLTGDTLEIEAPCLTRVRDRTALNSETRRDKWRVYVDNNRTGLGDPDPNTLVGAPYYFETTGNPGAAYGPMQKVYFDTPVRHGSVVNLADLPQEAAASVAALGAAAGPPRDASMQSVALTAGTTWIRPQPDIVYYTNASIGSVNLTVRDGPADRFYLACFAADASVGINVLTAAFINRGFILGYAYGDNDAIIEMRRREDGGGYYPTGMVRRGAFRANRGGTAQSIAAGTDVKVGFPTQVHDLGAYYNGTNSTYTPPRGRVDLTARVLISGLDSGASNFIAIRKNGTIIASHFFQGVGQASASVVLTGEPCTGADVFEVWANAGGASAKSVSGSTYVTEFSGVCW